jgi:hypothetical protein
MTQDTTRYKMIQYNEEMRDPPKTSTIEGGASRIVDSSCQTIERRPNGEIPARDRTLERERVVWHMP